MKFDVILVEADNLTDYNEPDTPVIRFDDVTAEELNTLLQLAAKQGGIFVCCLPCMDDLSDE